MNTIDYTKICFVVMPFGKKIVGEVIIDFDYIYQHIFAPAIEATPLPEGGYLIPRRTDKDFYSAHITVDMFQYIEYSRLTLADITGLNPNVFYELGVRHRAHPTGTPIFRQTNTAIPFDITSIKAFPYEYEPDEQIGVSKVMITEILTESLVHNKLDSPVQLALSAQKSIGSTIDSLLKDSENAIRHKNGALAISKYEQAIMINPTNPTLYLEVGLLYKMQGDWINAGERFKTAVKLSPNYSDAQRELGITQNKLFHRSKEKGNGLPTGENALREAIRLNNQDFDAYASLGGILKREGRPEEALSQYQKATEVSRGHPYPLLNVIKLQTYITGQLNLTERQRFQLNQAERGRKAQTKNNPPFDIPWSFFDLSDIQLYLGKEDTFIEYLNEGLFNCEDAWAAQTHLDSMLLTAKAFSHISVMDEAVELIKSTIPFLRQPEP
jgi:tetratricopeptide (TPR) repeat protein